ncbi:MAG TPA: helix-turn-helix domain-containing protein [Streptosporangiaceae bacterium]|jgi:DNA-binding HxlR family transcriptional regulator|nr:helix-turn-helix domain-containing protein [Streptosporangiaceae bacterium]
MTLPREYLGQDCPIARALEIVGERWTLLIVRDAFYGVRRFSDFRDHLELPRAVLTDRLNLLTEHGILARATAASGRDEYSLTAKGLRLWPVIWSLIIWGNEYYPSERPCRTYEHDGCGGVLAADGRCGACGAIPEPASLIAHPVPGNPKTDLVSQALSVPHRLLTPIAEVAAS